MAEPQIDVPDKILELVERFENNQAEYRQPAYKETQLRREFLDPLFKALGWDVDNEQGYAEAYKDVVHEDAIKMGRATKAPDYSFRIGGVRRFFLEAKKPGANLREDGEAAWQLRRYGWSAKLPLSLLSNFGELHVYDCRVKPVKGDKASHSRIKSFFFQEYPARWAELAAILSKTAVLKGAFDRYVEAKKIKKGTAEVDGAFLAEIERWRELLARNFALRNLVLSQRELNFAVQKTIDRIIFLRMGEDRGIEPYGRLQALLNGGQVYRRLFELFRQADDRYNSGLFHFQAEKERSDDLDGLTPNLSLDDTVLKDILRNLYYPDSPYEFAVLPGDILGQVYEQFLGKVIRLTAGHQAKVEYKPEVRKAGGVYYTPTYIVDYIVRQTVGQLMEQKKINRRASLTLRVLDPACGSGSFLLGAYQFLLDWHLEQYGKDPGKWVKGKQPRLYQAAKGVWKLSINERKRILLDHIFGVDLDPQAVEVTKLSLLLKVLEGEDQQSMGQLKLFHERALPDLGRNIKCGNSLIGPDFFRGQQTSLLGDDDLARINPFDWAAEFPEIMAGGGFEAVIGNPPYIFGRDWRALGIKDDVKLYLGKTYKSCSYQLDMFSIFMEKASYLCAINGFIGQIVPNFWLNNKYSNTTRSFIFNQANDLILLIPPEYCFKKQTVDTIVYSYQKIDRSGEYFQIKLMKNENIQDIAKHISKDYIDGSRPISTIIDNTTSSLISKIKENHSQLKDFADITRGVHSYRVGGYGVTAFGIGHQTDRDVKERPYHSKIKKKNFRGFIYGRDLKRYTPPEAKDYIHYGPWLAEPRKPEFFENERVYSRKILSERLVVTIEKKDSVADQQVYITIPKKLLNVHYIAGLLGSRLIAFFIRRFFNEGNDLFPQIKVTQLNSIPIRSIDFGDPGDAARHDRMVALVERMLDLQTQLAGAALPHDRERLRRQIEATDREIDGLVYELYGLTEAEIKLVEEKQG